MLSTPEACSGPKKRPRKGRPQISIEEDALTQTRHTAPYGTDLGGLHFQALCARLPSYRPYETNPLQMRRNPPPDYSSGLAEGLGEPDGTASGLGVVSGVADVSGVVSGVAELCGLGEGAAGAGETVGIGVAASGSGTDALGRTPILPAGLGAGLGESSFRISFRGFKNVSKL
jgi:hypothetical protein